MNRLALDQSYILVSEDFRKDVAQAMVNKGKQ